MSKQGTKETRVREALIKIGDLSQEWADIYATGNVSLGAYEALAEINKIARSEIRSPNRRNSVTVLTAVVRKQRQSQ